MSPWTIPPGSPLDRRTSARWRARSHSSIAIAVASRQSSGPFRMPACQSHSPSTYSIATKRSSPSPISWTLGTRASRAGARSGARRPRSASQISSPSWGILSATTRSRRDRAPGTPRPSAARDVPLDLVAADLGASDDHGTGPGRAPPIAPRALPRAEGLEHVGLEHRAPDETAHALGAVPGDDVARDPRLGRCCDLDAGRRRAQRARCRRCDCRARAARPRRTTTPAPGLSCTWLPISAAAPTSSIETPATRAPRASTFSTVTAARRITMP